jgi:hypothetical protein
MKSDSQTLASSQTTPLVSLFAVVATVLAGVVVYEQFFDGGAIEFGPFMMWLAITIPAGIFGSIILQVRAAERAKKVAKQVNARIAEIEAESRLSADPRRGSTPRLDQSLPDKDPFDEL